MIGNAFFALTCRVGLREVPMELRHLRYFVCVAEALSFTKAAEKLHTAQPSVTRQIKDLEDELGPAVDKYGRNRVQPGSRTSAIP
jgi:DNA-binding MarR family transcriptional regulator